MRFLSEGFAAFVLEYSVDAGYPVPLVEGALAMVYIREHAEEYGLDPHKVGVIGFSAGGHLAGMLTTLYRDAAVRATVGERLVRPDASLLCYPVLTTREDFTHGETARVISGGDPKVRSHLSLEDRVNADCPPVFLFHTMEDDGVPVENSLLFAAACRRAGVPFELHIFEKGWHGVSIISPETETDPKALEQLRPLEPWTKLALSWLKTRGFRVEL